MYSNKLNKPNENKISQMKIITSYNCGVIPMRLFIEFFADRIAYFILSKHRYNRSKLIFKASSIPLNQINKKLTKITWFNDFLKMANENSHFLLINMQGCVMRRILHGSCHNEWLTN